MKKILILLAIWSSINAMAQNTDTVSVYEEESINAYEPKADTIVKSTPKDDYEIKTLFSTKGQNDNGGFGALFINYIPKINNNSINKELLLGVRGGWIINHRFSIGLGGTFLVSNSFYGNKIPELPDMNVQMEMGYGGLYLEPIFMSKQPVHVTFPVLIGVGGAAYTRGRLHKDYDNGYEYKDVLDDSFFFVLEPGMNVEFNITRIFRIALTGKYRFVNGLELENTESSALDNWSVGMEFKFGVF